MYHMHYSTVLLAAVVNMVIGALWYSPLVFGKPWMKLVGLKASEMTGKKKQAQAQRGYAVAMVCSLVLAYALARVLVCMHAYSLVQGWRAAIWVWLGFVATTHAPNYVFEGKSIKLFAINMGRSLVSLLAMGTILAAWT